MMKGVIRIFMFNNQLTLGQFKSIECARIHVILELYFFYFVTLNVTVIDLYTGLCSETLFTITNCVCLTLFIQEFC